MPIDPLIAAGILRGAGQLGNSVLGAVTSKKNAKRELKHNKELSQYSYDLQQQQIDKQNEYNSPANQMQRYRDAGLNPHLIYGQGTPGNQTQIAEYQAPRANYQNVQPVQLPADSMATTIAEFQDYRLKNAQIDNVNAATKSTEAETVLKYLREQGILSDNSKKYLEAQLLTETYDYQKDAAKLKNRQMEQDYQRGKQNMTKTEKEMVLTDLKSEFQRYKNTWEKYGLSGRDRLYVKAVVMLLEEMGLDVDWVKDYIPDFMQKEVFQGGATGSW